MIVATAGHIDHGKTTLVRAITGMDTDRLPEEKARGISIDLGFAYWTPPGGGMIGFVDVPGHERFIRNMLAGVCAIDYAMLAVAADDGPMPQTREHLHIVDLLGINRGLVAITKSDRVSGERLQEVTASVRCLLDRTALADAEIVAVSAIRGDGMHDLRDRLVLALAAHVKRNHAGRHFRYVIDRAFTIPGSGTVVTGAVIAGSVAVGDKPVVSPAGTEVRVRSIQRHGQPVNQALAGERCALNLAGIKHTEVGRGDWLVARAVHAPTERLDARICVLAQEAHPVKHWTPVHLHIGTAAIPARIAIRRGESVAPGHSSVVHLKLDRKVAALRGDRFIIRDHSASRTIGGGSVIDPYPPAAGRNSPARVQQLAALEHAEPADALAALLSCCPGGVDISWFERVLNLTPDRIKELLSAADATAIGRERRVALPTAALKTLDEHLRQALARFHQEHPQALGAETELLRQQLAPSVGVQTFLALLQAFAHERKIEVDGSRVRLPQHVSTDNPRDEKTWQTIKPLLDAGGVNVPSVRELADRSSINESILRDFLHRKSRTGELIRVTPERFVARARLAQLAATARDIATAADAGLFTAAQFRDRIGTGRGLAIEILECLDRLEITARVGNARRYLRAFEPILGAACTTVNSGKNRIAGSAAARHAGKVKR